MLTHELCLSICLSRFRTVSKRLNISSQFLHHTVARLFLFYEYQTSSRNSDGVTPCEALNTGVV